MSRTPAKLTQADIARALRAAKQCGAGAVRLLPDGSITIDPEPRQGVGNLVQTIEDDEEVVL